MTIQKKIQRKEEKLVKLILGCQHYYKFSKKKKIKMHAKKVQSEEHLGDSSPSGVVFSLGI